jgi:quinol monooxygenase YgiN
MAALEAYRKGDQYQALMARAKNEGLLTGPPDVKVLQSVGGFSLRA